MIQDKSKTQHYPNVKVYCTEDEKQKWKEKHLEWKKSRQDRGFTKDNNQSDFYSEAINNYIELINIFGFDIDIVEEAKKLREENPRLRSIVSNLIAETWYKIWEAIPTDHYKSAHEIAKDAGLIKSHMNKFEQEAQIQDLQRDLKVFIYECEYEGRKPPLESTKDGYRRLE